MSKDPKMNPYKNVKMGFWKRLGWYLTYYRLPILAVTFAVIVLGYIIYLNVRPDRTDILNVTVVNGNTLADKEVFDRYLGEAGYDITENESFVHNVLHIAFDGRDEKAWDYFQIVTAQFISGDIDFFLSDGDIFSRFANYGAFLDVHEYLTPEQLERYADSILYVTNTETGEQMACGLILTPETELCQTYFFDTCYFGVSSNLYNDEEAFAVLDVILETLP